MSHVMTGAAATSHTTPSEHEDAIRTALLRSARHVHLRDPELLGELFHPDAVIATPDSDGPITVADALTRERGRSASLRAGQQVLTGIAIRIDGTAATSESHFLHAEVPDCAGPPQLGLLGGRMQDRWELRAGGWGVVEHVVTVDWRAYGDAAAIEAVQATNGAPAAVRRRVPILTSAVSDPGTTVARARIAEVTMRCARGIDRLDEDVFDRYFGEPMTMRFGDSVIPGAAFAAGSRADAGNRLATQHYVSNQLVEIAGDRARGEALLLGVIAYVDGAGPAYLSGEDAERGGVVLSGCRYVDDWVRGEDGWRLEQRELVSEWTGRFDGSEMEPLRAGPAAAGTRDREDPSYEVLFEPVGHDSDVDPVTIRQVEEVVRANAHGSGGRTRPHRHLFNLVVDVAGSEARCEAYWFVAQTVATDTTGLSGERELVELRHDGQRWTVVRSSTLPEWRTTARRQAS